MTHEPDRQTGRITRRKALKTGAVVTGGLAQAYLDAYENHNEGRIDNLEDYLVEDVVNHNPVLGDEIEPDEQHGLESFRRHAAGAVVSLRNGQVSIATDWVSDRAREGLCDDVPV